MTRWGDAAVSAAMFAIYAVAAPAIAEPAATWERPQSQAINASAHRHARHHRHYAYRPYPTYYGRPVTYAPAPFIPIPPLWGYGWEWW